MAGEDDESSLQCTAREREPAWDGQIRCRLGHFSAVSWGASADRPWPFHQVFGCLGYSGDSLQASLLAAECSLGHGAASTGGHAGEVIAARRAHPG